jgi:glycosyltransferase involved in cell wall biosynthesis
MVNLRAKLGIHHTLLMYVGNLERYQGIDLLLDSFALALRENPQASLVIIGGESSDIQRYTQKASRLNIQAHVYFLGPRPADKLSMYLSQADILVSPRVKGKNTPMKIYSYLDSGKALVATDLPTHTQVLHHGIAMLAQPNPMAFSQGILRLLGDENRRLTLGNSGKKFIQQNHTYNVFSEKLNGIYDWLHGELVHGAA